MGRRGLGHCASRRIRIHSQTTGWIVTIHENFRISYPYDKTECAQERAQHVGTHHPGGGTNELVGRAAPAGTAAT